MMAFKVLNLILLLVLVPAVHLRSSHSHEEKTLKINGETDPNIKDYPYIVNLWYNGQFRCAGTLISPKCVLTSAHCIKKENYVDSALWEVHANTTLLHEKALIGKVKGIHLPDNYTFALDMDVAILQLKERINVNKYVTLSTKIAKPGNSVTLAGWDYRSKCVNKACRKLQLAEVGVLIPFNIGTAYIVGASKGKSCGISAYGGPALHNGEQIGVVAAALHCNPGPVFGFYTALNNEKVKAFIVGNYCKYCKDDKEENIEKKPYFGDCKS